MPSQRYHGRNVFQHITRKDIYSFPMSMGKAGTDLDWSEFDERCLAKLGYTLAGCGLNPTILETEIGTKREVYCKLDRAELLHLGFVSAAAELN